MKMSCPSFGISVQVSNVWACILIQTYIPIFPTSIGNLYFSNRKALRKGGHVSLIPGSINIFVIPPTLARVLNRDTKQQECWVIKDKSCRIFYRWSVLSLLSCRKECTANPAYWTFQLSTGLKHQDLSHTIYIMRLRQATCSDHLRNHIYLQIPESGKRRRKG